MNPYETPEAKLEPPVELVASSLNWLAIVGAAVIYLVTQAISLMVILGLFLTPGIALTCFFAPWVLGAIFLGHRATQRWVAHAMIYSVIPPLSFVFFVLVMFGVQAVDRVLLISAIVAFVIAIFLTLLTMAATRMSR